MELKGNVAWVTGGASGLGEATTRAVVAAGGKVLVVDKNRERGEALEKEFGGAVRFVEADVTSDGDMTRAADAAAALGTLRLAVACAGVGWAKRTLSKEGEPHDLAFFETVIRVNLVGTFNLLRLAAARMAKNEPGVDGERGLVVSTASVAAFDGQIGQVAYAASKGGVVGLTLPAARDLSPLGIRVMAIAPGTFHTPMLAALPDKVREALAAGIPFPSRLGAPEEYAALVLHMAANRYLNGEVIRLDGALRMPPK